MMKRAFLVAAGFLFLTDVLAFSQKSRQNPHGNLRMKCESCHTAASWTVLKKPMWFKHEKTGFPLMGAHRAADCIGCHKSPVFSQVAVACADCHSDPHHGQFGFACQSCHTADVWKNRRDLLELHAQKGFPLTGMHAFADCAACHHTQIRGEYTGAANDCYGCHKKDYAAANPNHTSSGFSTECQFCHTTSSWGNSSFNHDRFFPIFSGKHKGRWTSCTTCHVNPSNYRVFECITCHAHAQAAMDDKHQGKRGYRYASSACYSCHPTGSK